MQGHVVRAGTAAVVGCITAISAAQTSPLTQRDVVVALDSGWVENDGDERGVVFSTLVGDTEATWLRASFDLAELGDAPPGGSATVLRITSVWDGAVQMLDADDLRQWRNTSAYFNGHSVVIEIVADPEAGRSRLVMSSFAASAPMPGGIASICGSNDNREPSSDPRSGRIVPQGCSVWIFNDENRCFLTAGHCNVGAGNIVEFNVPESLENGDIQHPDPEDQYVVDGMSVQDANTGVGNDWSYFGCFPNADTGLTPAEAQGAFHTLALEVPEVDDQDVRVTGYGIDESPLEWNQTQQTEDGPYEEADDSIIGYRVDTQGGNSGSAVVDEGTGLAIGIHTTGGCEEEGYNSGTAIDHDLIQEALANPRGVCVPARLLEFGYPGGLPELIDPDGGSIIVQILPTPRGTPDPATAVVTWQAAGGQPVTDPLIPLAGDLYSAELPPQECGTVVSYFFSVDTIAGETVFAPIDGAYSVLFADDFDFSFDDDFEQDQDWAVTESDRLTGGAWERGIPAGFGDRGDPAFDADGSSRCYVTGLADGDNDVDGGSTTLTSPIMDATEGDPHITYYRWFSNVGGGEPMTDVMQIEVSGDGGQSWVHLETVGPDGPEVEGGWFHKSFRVADHVPISASFRIRFTASDEEEGSIVEAGVDGVRLNRSAGGYLCVPCPADIDGNGAVDVLDLVAVITSWNMPGAADINGDGITNVLDLIEIVFNWGPCQ